MHPARKVLLVFAGGAAGALLRVLLLAIPAAHGPALEAAALAAVNVLGSLALGTLLGAVTAATPRADAVRAGLGTGVLGGFTSYSALVLLMLPAGGASSLGAVLGFLSLVAGIAAAFAGLRLGERGAARRSRPRGDRPRRSGA
ncbi:CrcB family protein [Leucobacter sp. CSA1]|uniref:Fluoride-specific ion channel FluC n=1 Tax=Leucobacter chromiisoli TaxID=2796471 RepID=A0A934Q519_9MICO|nr:CrcB family protein [Leucobacter chromiisoli]MBK0417758.1 CrcB family protein [Leucobacter chromiisoli]